MHRVLIAPPGPPTETLVIRDLGPFHHLTRVLRVKKGEAIDCLDGQGAIYHGLIRQVYQQAIDIEIVSTFKAPPPRQQLILALALIKQDNFEWALQKASELGVAQVVPLVTGRTVVRLSGGFNAQKRMQRWQRIIESALIQCGRAWAPQLKEPMDWRELLKEHKKKPGMVLTPQQPNTPLKQLALQMAQQPEIVVCIGPEGDFTLEELLQAQSCGWKLAGLGQTVLRAETACVVAITLLQAACDGFED